MYYPLQIPQILTQEYSRYINYNEEVIESQKGFVSCFWQSQPISEEKLSIREVILTDGGIDLVVDFDNQQIAYSGMSKTVFNYVNELPCRYMGVRLKSGAFEQLTGLPAKAAMDVFLHLDTVDESFNTEAFFSLSFEEAKAFLKDYIQQLAKGKTPNRFVTLFDELCDSPPETTAELYQQLHYSPRQCQRYFAKHYGLTPQMVLSILRFQYCLKILTSGQSSPSQVLELIAFYDQSHFIREFKKNIGLTPFEYLKKLTDVAYIQSNMVTEV